jgi:cytoskeletal protein CcmA (bactofilin family)
MADKQQTIIGPETRVVGEIRGEEDILVQGRVEGRMALTSELTIEEGAIVQADVEARVVLISGAVVGNVTATESVRLTSKARVVGDLTSPRVVIEAGAAYRGHLEMGNVEGGARRESSATRRTSEPAKAPPRISAPSRVAAAPGAVAARVATASPPRAATPARTPPSLPRAEAAAAGGVASAPHPWAKKKLHRRG